MNEHYQVLESTLLSKPDFFTAATFSHLVKSHQNFPKSCIDFHIIAYIQLDILLSEIFKESLNLQP